MHDNTPTGGQNPGQIGRQIAAQSEPEPPPVREMQTYLLARVRLWQFDALLRRADGDAPPATA